MTTSKIFWVIGYWNFGHYLIIVVWNLVIHTLASRVIPLMNFLQSLPGHMGIDLSGRDIHMAEHHLYRTKVRSPFQKMAGKGVTKKMGGDPLSKPRSPRILFEIFPESLSAHPLS